MLFINILIIFIILLITFEDILTIGSNYLPIGNRRWPLRTINDAAGALRPLKVREKRPKGGKKPVLKGLMPLRGRLTFF
jgi:hypothetical protein